MFQYLLVCFSRSLFGISLIPLFYSISVPSSNTGDDVYFKIDEAHIELYTDAKDPEVEARVETVLDQHGVFYEKTEVWIESELLYEVLYSFELEG